MDFATARAHIHAAGARRDLPQRVTGEPGDWFAPGLMEGITPSIGSIDDAYDNALMESINGLYKTERIGLRGFTAERLESSVDAELAMMS